MLAPAVGAFGAASDVLDTVARDGFATPFDDDAVSNLIMILQLTVATAHTTEVHAVKADVATNRGGDYSELFLARVVLGVV